MARARRSASLSVAADWSAGMVNDPPRTALPESAVYNITDFLVHRPGLLEKRGGSSYAGPSLPVGVAYAHGVVHADFPAGKKLVAIGFAGSTNNLSTVTAGTTTNVSSLNAEYATLDNPKLHIGTLIITANNGTSAPIYYDGATTVGTLGGTPPPGKFSELYKTRLVLANTLAFPNRAFFSPTPDITATWNTADSWIDCDHPITGMASLSNQLLVWSLGHMERIIGSTPPPGSDMDHTVIAAVGCTDARSIVVYNNQAIFANPGGVYITNGAGMQLLTKDRIERYWQSLFSGYSTSTWTIAGGLLGSYYIVSIINNGVLIDTLMLDIERRAWTRHSNIVAGMFSRTTSVSEELYYADRSAPRIVALSGMFTPAAANKTDANGTAVAPTAELRLVGDTPGLKHHGFGHITLDMRDAGSDDPVMAVSAASGIEATTFSTVTESPLTETVDAERRRFTIGKVSQAMNVKLQQTGASAKTEVYAVEVETRPFATTAGGQ